MRSAPNQGELVDQVTDLDLSTKRSYDPFGMTSYQAACDGRAQVTLGYITDYTCTTQALHITKSKEPRLSSPKNIKLKKYKKTSIDCCLETKGCEP